MILWAVKEGWGYIVEAYDANNNLLDRCERGDCWSNSHVFGTGQITGEKLKELALYTAELFGKQYELEEKPLYCKDLLK